MASNPVLELVLGVFSSACLCLPKPTVTLNISKNYFACSDYPHGQWSRRFPCSFVAPKQRFLLSFSEPSHACMACTWRSHWISCLYIPFPRVTSNLFMMKFQLKPHIERVSNFFDRLQSRLAERPTFQPGYYALFCSYPSCAEQA